MGKKLNALASFAKGTAKGIGYGLLAVGGLAALSLVGGPVGLLVAGAMVYGGYKAIKSLDNQNNGPSYSSPDSPSGYSRSPPSRQQSHSKEEEMNSWTPEEKEAAYKFVQEMREGGLEGQHSPPPSHRHGPRTAESHEHEL